MPLLTKKWFNFIVGAVLIDGRNRLRACLELAIETKLQPFQEENEPDPGRYILAINLERRHLTEEHLGTSVPEFRITSAATKQPFIGTKAMRWILAEDSERRKNQGRKEGGRGHKVKRADPGYRSSLTGLYFVNCHTVRQLAGA